MSMSDVFALFAVLVAVVSALIAWQIGQRSLRITTYRSATDLMLEVDRIFVEHPHLRPYFYNGATCPDDHPEHNRVQAVAELKLDVLECIWDSNDTYTDDDRDAWEQYIRDVFKKSPAIRQMYHDPEYKGWYPTLDSLLLPKTNSPHHPPPQPTPNSAQQPQQ